MTCGPRLAAVLDLAGPAHTVVGVDDVDLPPGLDAGTAEALTRLAAAAPSAPLLILAGDPALTHASAAALALAWAGPDSPDVVVAAPAGVRWTLAEVDQQVLTPALRRPQVRTVIVLHDGHALGDRPAERLLRVTEEPPDPLLVVVCTETAQALPVPLRGRAARVVDVHGLSGPALVEALSVRLAAAGDHGHALAEALVDAGLGHLLADPVAAALARGVPAGQLVDAVARLQAAWQGRRATPVLHAAQLLTDLEMLSGPATGSGEAAKRARSLQRAVLARMTRTWSRSAVDGVDRVDALGWARSVARLQALDRAAEQLAMNASPSLVLAALAAS